MPQTTAQTNVAQTAADLLDQTLQYDEAGLREKANESALITIAAALTALALKD